MWSTAVIQTVCTLKKKEKKLLCLIITIYKGYPFNFPDAA